MTKTYFESVYEIVARIPEGKVATYGQVAAMLGNPRAARTVGWAMRAVPLGLRLPCHRVVNKTGTLAPSYAFDGYENQRAMLEAEGVTFTSAGNINMAMHLWVE